MKSSLKTHQRFIEKSESSTEISKSSKKRRSARCFRDGDPPVGGGGAEGLLEAEHLRRGPTAPSGKVPHVLRKTVLALRGRGHMARFENRVKP